MARQHLTRLWVCVYAAFHLSGTAGYGNWVVDLDPGLPTLTDVMANWHDSLVDDDCGREVGVVEGVDLDPDSAAPERLPVVQGWGRRRTTVSIDKVIEITPGERRLVIACRDGHARPRVRSA